MCRMISNCTQHGGPGGARTLDFQLAKLTLIPTELQAHIIKNEDEYLGVLAPAEGIEPPTYGLTVHCSTY